MVPRYTLSQIFQEDPLPRLSPTPAWWAVWEVGRSVEASLTVPLTCDVTPGADTALLPPLRLKVLP